MILLLGALAVLVIACGGGREPVSSGSRCTAGTDCYCDKVKNVSDPLYDANLLFCEDFEAPTMRLNQGVGNGAPYYGPWYDSTGWAGGGNNRGFNSYWSKVYGGGTDGFLWLSNSNQPPSPQYGSACSVPASAFCGGGLGCCSGHKTWDSENRWDGNNYSPMMAIYDSASDFDAEIASMEAPTNTAGGGPAGCFDGNACLAFRIQVGATSGIAGEAGFTAVTEVGLTMAIAYPNNSLSSGIWGTDALPAAWKHNEWTTANPDSGKDGLFIFYNQNGPRSGRPFAGFFSAFETQNYSGSIIAETLGRASASALGVDWNTPTNYSQTTDWPEGTWGCVRGHWKITGSTQRMRVWFQGPGMSSEREIVDVTFETSTLDNRSGYMGMAWNAYANANSGTGYVPTTELTFRYEDNVHARAGTPVSCAQIGFTGAI